MAEKTNPVDVRAELGDPPQLADLPAGQPADQPGEQPGEPAAPVFAEPDAPAHAIQPRTLDERIAEEYGRYRAAVDLYVNGFLAFRGPRRTHDGIDLPGDAVPQGHTYIEEWKATPGCLVDLRADQRADQPASSSTPAAAGE